MKRNSSTGNLRLLQVPLKIDHEYFIASNVLNNHVHTNNNYFQLITNQLKLLLLFIHYLDHFDVE